MRTIAVANQKGGSAKTTSAVNLAAALGEIGRKVLLVDLDPQTSASAWLGSRDDNRGLLDALTDNGNLSDLVCNTAVAGVELIAASPWLVGAERMLAGQAGAETVLRGKLQRLGERWDFVFLDCPPSLGLLVLSALVAAEEVLVPLEPSPIALAGVVQLLRTIEQVRERLNSQLEVSTILLARTDSRTSLCREVEQSVRERFGNLVLHATIPETVRFREAWSHSKPILTYAPRSPGAEAYRAAAKELKRRTR